MKELTKTAARRELLCCANAKCQICVKNYRLTLKFIVQLFSAEQLSLKLLG